jgi:homoserine kinase type II
MQHLAAHGIPVPAPQPDADGSLVHTPVRQAGRGGDAPARQPPLAPDAAHCAQVGAMLARLHLAGAASRCSSPPARPGLVAADRARGAAASRRRAAALLRDELAFQQQLARRRGPGAAAGPIHADLFRDNVMFDDTAGPDRLCGLFDFYFAGTDTCCSTWPCA